MKSIKTTCVHAGTIFDEKTRGVNSPIYPSTSFAYLDKPEAVYPRYFNIPNTEALGEKIAALEQSEKGLVFSSGMAAITSTLLAFLQQGDHAIFQTGLYGGTFHFVTAELERFGIEYDIAPDNRIELFESLVRDNTRLIYIETPSNPLLKITDIRAVVALAKKHRQRKRMHMEDIRCATGLRFYRVFRLFFAIRHRFHDHFDIWMLFLKHGHPFSERFVPHLFGQVPVGKPK